jgi:acetyl/propionyl-CoA carboxylase alpha subunit
VAEPGGAPQVTSLGEGRFLVEEDGARTTYTAFALLHGRATWVFLDGDVYVFQAESAGSRSVVAEAESSLSAPMPARVLSVAVEVGQVVAKGDVLVTLEAMKMELPIRAPRDGTVASVSCQTGRMVGAGDPLVELK